MSLMRIIAFLHAQVTFVHLVPPVMLMMAQHPLVSDYDLSALRRLVVAAAPVAPWTIEKALERLNNPHLIAKQGKVMLALFVFVAQWHSARHSCNKRL